MEAVKLDNLQIQLFFVLTIDQFATLRCPEKGTDIVRLWIFPTSDGSGYPLCRTVGLDGNAPQGAIDDITANQP